MSEITNDLMSAVKTIKTAILQSQYHIVQLFTIRHKENAHFLRAMASIRKTPADGG